MSTVEAMLMWVKHCGRKPGIQPHSEGADRSRYSQLVIPAKAGIQGMGVSFDELRTNDVLLTNPCQP